MKYVMFKTPSGLTFPVIFPDAITHRSMASSVLYTVRSDLKQIAEPVSAGFVTVGVGTKAYGS